MTERRQLPSVVTEREGARDHIIAWGGRLLPPGYPAGVCVRVCMCACVRVCVSSEFCCWKISSEENDKDLPSHETRGENSSESLASMTRRGRYGGGQSHGQGSRYLEDPDSTSPYEFFPICDAYTVNSLEGLWGVGRLAVTLQRKILHQCSQVTLSLPSWAT